MRVLPEEPQWIGAAALLAIHAQQIERYGGGHGVLYPDVALATLTRVRHGWSNRTGTDLADLAAMYLVGFIRTAGFHDGNKRTGLACALAFLAINGVAVSAHSNALYNQVREVANGNGDDQTVAAFFRSVIPERTAGISPPAPPPAARSVREFSLA